MITGAERRQHDVNDSYEKNQDDDRIVSNISLPLISSVINIPSAQEDQDYADDDLQRTEDRELGESGSGSGGTFATPETAVEGRKSEPE